MEINEFYDELGEMLANLHLTEIEKHIILPAIEQIIDDCEDYLEMDGKEGNQETERTLFKYGQIRRLLIGENKGTRK